MKKRNPRFGYLRIARQIQHAFGIVLDKGVVKRVLDKHHQPTEPFHDGSSWLTFLGHMKDSLWSVDLFRCESIALKSHNAERAHSALNRKTPEIKDTGHDKNVISFAEFRWKSPAQKLFQLPIAA